VAQHFAWVHTLDRRKLAGRLDAHRPHYAPPLNICLQVNLAGESQKGGIEPACVTQLAADVAALPRLMLRGLMTVPPTGIDPKQTAKYFGQLANLQRSLIDEGHELDTLSMGMSSDLEIAIAAGSTLIRVGTAVFGPRAE
jgi:pyridoxal phosphate enzyme (YggS family)